VPYLKISRDKRGYETYFLLEPPADRSKHARPRLLFWFRTPPQVKIGREPFSEEIRQAIESQNPDLRFDWPRLMATQPPPLDVQRWRERRRLERAARQAAREGPESEAEVAATVANGAEELPIDDVDTPRHSIEAAVDATADAHADHAQADQAHAGPSPSAEQTVSADSSSEVPEVSTAPSRRRRRRRRGRRHDRAQGDGSTPPPPSSGSPPSSEEV